MGLRVDRVGPAGPQRLLNPVLAATRTANKLNTIQYGGWRKLFSEGELQLSEIGKNLVQKIRITGICDMVFCSAARTKHFYSVVNSFGGTALLILSKMRFRGQHY